MGKVDFMNLTLNKQNAVYFPGETLTGSVNYKISERLKINKVKLIAIGEGCVRWTETHGSGKDRSTRTYTGYEKYFFTEINLVAKQSNNDLYLECGEYQHPFQILLPPMLPTSFEHHDASIRYKLVATIDIPWAFDKHSTRSFTVLSQNDLNKNVGLKQPYVTNQSKTLCCLCCQSDPITVTLTLKQSK